MSSQSCYQNRSQDILPKTSDDDNIRCPCRRYFRHDMHSGYTKYQLQDPQRSPCRSKPVQLPAFKAGRTSIATTHCHSKDTRTLDTSEQTYHDFNNHGLFALVQSSMIFQKCATTDLSMCLRCGSILSSVTFQSLIFGLGGSLDHVTYIPLT